ncbi:MAG: hypothetical protein H0W36_15845 [Gemmatimonadetes bacterium]|nr:hypothetical protein [Gemmatimonadota bacterium]
MWRPLFCIGGALYLLGSSQHPREALASGLSTPVLTTHLWFATLVYPLFAVAMIGLILMGQRERSLGSPWIGWLGVVGAIAHGSVMCLVFVHDIGWTGLLFPIAAIALSAWFILAGVWPVRRSMASPELGAKPRPG